MIDKCLILRGWETMARTLVSGVSVCSITFSIVSLKAIKGILCGVLTIEYRVHMFHITKFGFTLFNRQKAGKI